MVNGLWYLSTQSLIELDLLEPVERCGWDEMLCSNNGGSLQHLFEVMAYRLFVEDNPCLVFMSFMLIITFTIVQHGPCCIKIFNVVGIHVLLVFAVYSLFFPFFSLFAYIATCSRLGTHLASFCRFRWARK